MHRNRALLAALAANTFACAALADTVSVRHLFKTQNKTIVVVAHRGCHNAAPAYAVPPAPENSLGALESCVKMGVDMLEIDVRRSADGELVVIHDPTVDRTTTGSGRVNAMTLADLRALRLRQNLGGSDAAATGEQIATLDEMLIAARGRILLNLDVKEAVHAEAIAAVTRTNMQDQVIVKAPAGPLTRPLASMTPYDQVPFAPILQHAPGQSDLLATAMRQLDRAQPIAFELPTMTPQQLLAVADFARTRGVPLWVNTLWSGFVLGWGGDADALRNPDQVWGRMYRTGVRIFQTDEPAALIAFRSSQTLHPGRSGGIVSP